MTDARVAREGWRTADRYRTVPERTLCAALLLSGWAYEQRARQPGLDGAAEAALDQLVALGLPWRLTDAGRCFDPVETLNFIKWCCLAGADTLWTDRWVSTNRRLVADAAATTAGLQQIAIAFQRTFNLERLPRGQTVRLRLPLPAPHASLVQAHTSIERTSGLQCSIASDHCRIEARGIPPDAASLTIAARVQVTLDQGVPDLEPADLDLYLRPEEGLIQVTSGVQRLSAALAGSRTDRGEIVRCFLDFFLDHLCLGAVHYDQVEAARAASDWVLETGWCDCQIGAALLVALCRARGIPARLVGGLQLYPLAPTPHFWAEVWFEDAGWLPFDLASWDLSAGGRERDWRHHFSGRVSARLITQRMPLQFTGSPGISLRSPWHVVSTATPSGSRTGLYGVDDFQLIIEDEIAVMSQTEAHEACVAA